jgi:uncharacterized protein
MEDVLASIRRAIDENAQGHAAGRFGGSMAELRVKLDPPSSQAEPRGKRDYAYPSTNRSHTPQGFAGILGGKRDFGASRSRANYTAKEPAQAVTAMAPDPAEGQYLYDGYYGAQVEDYAEPVPESYQADEPLNAPRYLPPAPPVIADYRQGFSQNEGLLSQASSEATQAAFSRLAETITRQALGERPIADVAQELLRTMLKQWLDDNLPKIVERLVREEIERVVRRPQR